MYFNKIDHPSNFSFIQSRKTPYSIGKRSFAFRITDLGSDVHRLEVRSRSWRPGPSLTQLDSRAFSGARSTVSLTHGGPGELRLAREQLTLFASRPAQSFGVCGPKWVFQFEQRPSYRFYGLGEKSGALEKSGTRTTFWNVDVMGDFSPADVENTDTDPMYVSIPYVLIRLDEGYLGILVDNPFAVFMNLGAADGLTQDREGERPELFVGSTDGTPVLYFIYGASADDVTCKLHKLCGSAPLPPLWALGHHQSRWGYQSYADLVRLDRAFSDHGIPDDGLWLDIDYMDGYRVFSIGKDKLAEPQPMIADLAARGRRVVPILDPGIKLDKQFPVYREGVSRGLFCKNAEGHDYVGHVWPGSTVFPDFSLPEARAWWAAHVRELAALGFAGFWLDMNDPSTGSVAVDEMRFGRGRFEHQSFHNQYALGMQIATREGLLAARPDRRPFLVSRSGSVSTSRYAAIWTGDNVSSFRHLRASIPTCLNLSLSGVSHCGADVPGFGGDATPELAAAWYKAAFLFPLLRNHAWKGAKPQEPWAFGRRTERVIAHYIRTRYKLLPYLYNLFIEQEEQGRPIVRPMFYEFPSERFGRVDDQFMVGSSILQAPVLAENKSGRRLLLPEGRWYSAWDRRWLRGDREIRAVQSARSTPLFVREGAVIPMQRGERLTNANDLVDIELHLFVSEKYEGVASYAYHADDGESFAHLSGARSSVQLMVSRERRNVIVDVRPIATGYGAIRMRFFVYDYFGGVIVRRGDKEDEMTVLTLKTEPWDFVGTRLLPLAATESITIE